jgi:hypothetical protein
MFCYNLISKSVKSDLVLTWLYAQSELVAQARRHAMKMAELDEVEETIID